jgi:hypothetical protein
MLIKEIYFLPPLAIARLGGSDTPLDCFVWNTDQSLHGGNRTVIEPAVSLRVMSNGSVRPFVPKVIQFRDGELLRPVAPFFELWAKLEDGTSRPLTERLMQDVDPSASLQSVEYRITVANRKAQRRTRSAACAYIAREVVSGDDHQRKQLLAYSPNVPGEEPLVSAKHKIPLGRSSARPWGSTCRPCGCGSRRPPGRSMGRRPQLRDPPHRFRPDRRSTA